MATLTLRYELQRDTGLPRVTVVEGELTGSERCSLDTELRRQYERLVRCRPAVVRLRTRLAGFPEDAVFRLRILPGVSPRCPTLLLSCSAPTASPVQPAAAGKVTGWVDGFLDELRESLAAGYLTDSDPEEQAVLERRIERLATLYRQQPARLARLLLQGVLERLRVAAGQGSAPL